MSPYFFIGPTEVTTAFTVATDDYTTRFERFNLNESDNFYLKGTVTGGSSITSVDKLFTLTYVDACRTATIVPLVNSDLTWIFGESTLLSIPAFLDTVDTAT